MIKNFILGLFGLLCCMTSVSSLHGQSIEGSFSDLSVVGQYIYLSEILGRDSHVLDSVKINKKGVFKFNTKEYELGFYELSLNDTSKADVFLSPKEKKINLAFKRVDDLKEGIVVSESLENEVLHIWYRQFQRQNTGYIHTTAWVSHHSNTTC